MNGFKLVIICSGALGLAASSVAAAKPFAYVTNAGSDTVSVIDTATKSVAAAVSVGLGAVPINVAVSPKGNYAYITNGQSDSVSVIDTGSNTVVDTIAVDSPAGIAVTPDGTAAYVATSAAVTVIDTASNAVAATVTLPSDPDQVAIAPDGRVAYVTHPSLNNISVIDIASNTATATVAAGFENPVGVAFAPIGFLAYVTDATFSDNPAFLSVIDSRTNKGVGGVAVGQSTAVVVGPDGAKAYVAVGEMAEFAVIGFVKVIDTGTNTVTATIPVDHNPSGIAITPDGAFVYVVNSDSNSVSVIDTGMNGVIATIPVGSSPRRIAIASGRPSPCAGDCNSDRSVTVDELLTMVDIALGNEAESYCRAGDADHDGQITVDEILTGVNKALGGCV